MNLQKCARKTKKRFRSGKSKAVSPWMFVAVFLGGGIVLFPAFLFLSMFLLAGAFADDHHIDG